MLCEEERGCSVGGRGMLSDGEVVCEKLEPPKVGEGVLCEGEGTL